MLMMFKFTAAVATSMYQVPGIAGVSIRVWHDDFGGKSFMQAVIQQYTRHEGQRYRRYRGNEIDGIRVQARFTNSTCRQSASHARSIEM